MFKVDEKSFFLGMASMVAILIASHYLFKLLVGWWFGFL